MLRSLDVPDSVHIAEWEKMSVSTVSESGTSISGMGGVMMGSRRRSRPCRITILSSLVWLSRGPRIFRSCLPRTSMKSNVCWPVDKSKSKHQCLIWIHGGSKTTHKGHIKHIYWHLNEYELILKQPKIIKANISWRVCVPDLQCWEPSLQRRLQPGCTPHPQCSAGLFCVAAGGVEPEVRGHRDC